MMRHTQKNQDQKRQAYLSNKAGRKPAESTEFNLSFLPIPDSDEKAPEVDEDLDELLAQFDDDIDAISYKDFLSTLNQEDYQC